MFASQKAEHWHLCGHMHLLLLGLLMRACVPVVLWEVLDCVRGAERSTHVGQELAEKNAKGLPVAPLQGLKGTVHEHVVSAVPCPWAHPGKSCDWAALSFFPAAYLRALPVYLPVYIAPAILVHR